MWHKQKLLIILAILCQQLYGQSMTYREYIDKYSGLAVAEMIKYRIPASITLAQGLLESGAGTSELAVNANNHFGIKCQQAWGGKTYRMDDDEKDECFRKYDSPEDSYRDHSLFLTTRDRYAFLFDLDMLDYKAWARGLKEAGYATNPRYAELLIRIVDENELYLYDSSVEAGKKDEKKHKAGTDKGTGHETAGAVAAGEAEGKPATAFFGTWGSGREIYLNNRVKFIYAKPGDTWQGIAAEFGIYGWQVRKYNELKMDEQPVSGEMVYIEHKKGKASVAVHTVKEGESMRNISQHYGVKLNALYRLNGMKKGTQPEAGEHILLRKI